MRTRGACSFLARTIFGTLIGAFVSANASVAETLLASSNLALTGRVTSVQEGAMEGVVVSAQRTGSPTSITVVTDQTGRYGFPAERMPAGHYALRIRAVGYELDAPAGAEVAAKGTVTADLALRKAD